MADRVFKLKRRINAGKVTRNDMQQASAQERWAEKQITGNIHYQKIKEALIEGVSMPEIARWVAKEGWITISEPSFLTALKVFCSLHPAVIKGADNEFDEIVSAHKPNGDALKEMNRLLRFQKARMAIDYGHEKSVNKLFASMTNEVKVTKEIIVEMAKIEGSYEVGANAINDHGYDDTTREKFKAIRQDEEGFARMRSIVNTFKNKILEHATESTATNS